MYRLFQKDKLHGVFPTLADAEKYAAAYEVRGLAALQRKAVQEYGTVENYVEAFYPTWVQSRSTNGTPFISHLWTFEEVKK